MLARAEFLEFHRVPMSSLPFSHLILDMDGVLWHGETPIPGLTDFFATLHRLGIGFALATNNATRNAALYVQKLARFGVTVTPEQIVTSSDAAANHLRSLFSPGTPIYVVGEQGLQQAVAAQGFTVITDPDYTRINGHIPAVVVGLTRQVTYNELACATLLIHRGATFIGTNPDVTYPSEYGELPGAGAVIAFVAAASGVQPTLIGKPGPILFQEALRRLNAAPATTAMVGDRLETDIAGGKALGLQTILVLSGISGRADITRTQIHPDFIFDDINALAHHLTAGR